MKIALVGPGLMPIPPTGWGAVESVIWDYKEVIEQISDHDVEIINCNQHEILREIDRINPDFVHIHYDEYFYLAAQIKQPTALTAHYAYLTQSKQWGDYYNRIMSNVLAASQINNKYIFALSDEIKNQYVKFGVDKSKVFVVPNGARSDKFHYETQPLWSDYTLYLGKIEERKKQYKYQSLGIMFAGNKIDDRFTSPNYLGEWSKKDLYAELTSCTNLVLLSDAEAAPLVVVEALMAGLGVVISECAAANINPLKDFIDIIPNNKLDDLKYIQQIIIENCEKSVQNRAAIRQYALDNFDWQVILKRYVSLVEVLVTSKGY